MVLAPSILLLPGHLISTARARPTAVTGSGTAIVSVCVGPNASGASCNRMQTDSVLEGRDMAHRKRENIK